MAKSKRKKTYTIAKRSLFTKKIKHKKITPLMMLGQDERAYRPKQQKKRDILQRRRIILKTHQPKTLAQGAMFFGGDKELKKTVCQGRQSRKEVLFSKKIAGQGGKKKQHKRTWKSKVRCK